MFTLIITAPTFQETCTIFITSILRFGLFRFCCYYTEYFGILSEQYFFFDKYMVGEKNALTLQKTKRGLCSRCPANYITYRHIQCTFFLIKLHLFSVHGKEEGMFTSVTVKTYPEQAYGFDINSFPVIKYIFIFFCIATHTVFIYIEDCPLHLMGTICIMTVPYI